MQSQSRNKEVFAQGNTKKTCSIDSQNTEGDSESKRNEMVARSASVPCVVYQEDISVKNITSKHKTEPLTTKMRVLITSCDESTNIDETTSDTESTNIKSNDSENTKVENDRKESTERDSLEESEESDWFNSDLSTPEYPSRRNSYNSNNKRGSLETYGDTCSMNNEPWTIDMLLSGNTCGHPVVTPFSPTFRRRKFSGGSYTTSIGTSSNTSLLKVPSLEDNTFKQEIERCYLGNVEMRPISTACASIRRRSTTALQSSQARYRSSDLI